MSQPLTLAFVLDPLAGLKPAKDSSIAMMRAAQRRGHTVVAIEASTLAWRRPEQPGQAGVFGEAIALELLDEDADDWYREKSRHTAFLRDFDAVLMRKDPPFDFEFITATWLLERAEAEGAKVFNRPAAIRDHSEKLAITEFDAYTPITLVAADMARLHAFIDEHRDIILKPLDGMGGSQVYRVRHDDPNRNVIVETLSDFGARTVMAQKHLAGIANGDKRILLIAGQVMPYALARIPKAGETRGNLAAGGTGVARELSARDREIADTLAPILWARGLLIIGLDVIGEHLTEINVTSPTCMVEIAQQTGCDVAAAVITALETACASKV